MRSTLGRTLDANGGLHPRMPAGGRQCVGIYYQLRLQFLKVTVVHLKCHAHQNGVSGDAVRRVC